MNKIYILFDYRGVPFFYLESSIINDAWLLQHDITDYDIVETILDLDHFESLFYESWYYETLLKNIKR